MSQSASQRTFQPYARLAVIALFDEPGTRWLLPMAPAVGLEVEPRSVRRYITMLQDMGIPIEAVRGPGCGYRLRPGFKLPPLMLNDEEATAVVEFQAPLVRVRQQIPASYGAFEETPGGVRFTTEYGDLADIARFLVACKLPFVVHEPPALREELLRLAATIARSAPGCGASTESPGQGARLTTPVDPLAGQTTT